MTRTFPTDPVPQILSVNRVALLAAVGRQTVLRLAAAGAIRTAGHLDRGKTTVPIFNPDAVLEVHAAQKPSAQ